MDPQHDHSRGTKKKPVGLPGGLNRNKGFFSLVLWEVDHFKNFVKSLNRSWMGTSLCMCKLYFKGKEKNQMIQNLGELNEKRNVYHYKYFIS